MRPASGTATLVVMATAHDPTIIGRSVESAHHWYDDVAAELGTDDLHYAARALRAVLHALRDRLTVEEGAQLAAQLPTLIRGIYYEQWKPGAVGTSPTTSTRSSPTSPVRAGWPARRRPRTRWRPSHACCAATSPKASWTMSSRSCLRRSARCSRPEHGSAGAPSDRSGRRRAAVRDA